MARPAVPHDIIASRGVKLDLYGQDVTLVYTFAAIARVEDTFGSVQAALIAMSRNEGQQTATARMLACGLGHETDTDGAPLSDVDALFGLLDTNRADDYQTAILEALGNAVPAIRAALDEQKEAEPDPTTGETETDSPGPTGTTSPPSSSDAPTPSGGP